MPALVLASTSPRRRALLTQLGLSFDVSPVDIDETVRHNENALEYTQRLANEKARTCYDRIQDNGAKNCLVLGADTALDLDGAILGKPCDKAHACAMLAQLSGRSHQAVTSFSVVGASETLNDSCVTTVVMGSISPTQRESYWDSGEPHDKAGGYAIQGFGAIFVERIEGSYSNVVGLPLREVAATLQVMGIDVLGKNNKGMR